MPSFEEKLDDSLVRYIAYSNFKNYVSGINIRNNDNVLEIGCGGGNLSRFLAQKNPNGKLYCVDVSPYWISKARQRLSEFDNVSFFRGEIKDFKDEIIILKDFKDVRVEAKIENKGGRAFSLTVAAKEKKTQQECCRTTESVFYSADIQIVLSRMTLRAPFDKSVHGENCQRPTQKG